MKTIALYNVKGGVGKTTAAVNLAYLASTEGRRTLLWDLDAQGAASYYLEVMPGLKASSRKLVKRKSDLGKHIHPTRHENLDVLPADFANRNMDVTLGDVKKPAARIARLVKPLAGTYEYVFLDCPPSISVLSESVFRAADLLVVPVIPTPLSLRSIEQLRGFLEETGIARTKVCAFFSMVDRRKGLHKRVTGSPPPVDTICRTCIPYLSSIERMGVERLPLPAFEQNSRGTRAFTDLWEEIRERVWSR